MSIEEYHNRAFLLSICKKIKSQSVFLFKTMWLQFGFILCFTDSINIKILNAGAWARGSERVTVSLPLELEDYIPEVEDFYKKKHSGRKLQWYHHMSNGTVS